MYEKEKQRMISEQLIRRGIRDERILTAILNVPRHLFVDEHLRDEAYADGPLPIGFHQTISQPFIVAYMMEKLDLQPYHKVLEIGTGCGYQTALLAQLVKRVFTMERIGQLADSAEQKLQSLHYKNIEVFTANGWGGLPDYAPFDRIMVTAAAQSMPKNLLNQLIPLGKMIIPLGKLKHTQHLILVSKSLDKSVIQETLIPVRFVPLITP